MMEEAAACSGKAESATCSAGGMDGQCNALFGGRLMCVTNAQTWRAAIETAFDVDLFLRWLAVNGAIQNWDAYGALAHNYYLYGDPAQKGRLRWIPWDNNFAFGTGPGGAGRGVGPFGGSRPDGPPPPGFPEPRASRADATAALPLGRGMPMFGPGAGNDVLYTQIGDRWPLIQRLLADDVYARRYREHLGHALGGLFASDAVDKRARELHNLIASSVVGAQGERATHTTVASPAAFERAIDGPGGLLDLIRQRRDAVRTALEGANSR